MVMNSPCAMLITPIWPKMMASPNPMSSSTANRLRPAKPCIRPMFSISERDMRGSGGRRGRECRGRTPGQAGAGPRRRGLLVALGERVRLDQLGRLGHHLEGGVGHAHRDARLAPQVVVGVQLDVALGRGLELDAGGGGGHDLV